MPVQSFCPQSDHRSRYKILNNFFVNLRCEGNFSPDPFFSSIFSKQKSRYNHSLSSVWSLSILKIFTMRPFITTRPIPHLHLDLSVLRWLRFIRHDLADFVPTSNFVCINTVSILHSQTRDLKYCGTFSNHCEVFR